MKLSNIRGINFRSFDNFELNDPAQINVIVGQNGAGKTSILELIKYIITGEAQEPIVKAGAVQCSASAELLGVEVKRNAGKKNNLRIDNRTTTQKSWAQIVTENTGCTMDSVKVATSTNMLGAMNSGKFAEFLISNNLIPVEIDFDILTKLCSMSPEAELELSMQLPSAPIKFGAEAIDEAYSYYFASRTALKNELARKRVEAAFEGEAPIRTVAAVDAELSKLSLQNNEIDVYKKLKESYDKIAEQRAKVITNIKEVEDAIRNIGYVPVVDNNAKESLEKRLEEQRGILNTLQDTQKTLEVNIDMFKRSISNLSSDRCPFSTKLVCTTDKSVLLSELQATLDLNIAELNKILAEISDKQNSISIFETKLKEIQALEEKNAELARLYEKRASLKSAIPDLPAKPVEPQISNDVVSEKYRLEEERKNIIRYEDSKKAAAEVAHLEQRLKVYDELIILLSPKSGIKQAIMSVALEPIVEHCNDRAKDLKLNFEVGLLAENGVKIVCNPDTSNIDTPLPLESVSAGEQAYALFLIMDALNALHGLGILLLDDIDKLDSRAFLSLIQLVTRPDVAVMYDHIFISLVNHEDAMNTLKVYAGQIKVISL